MRVKCGKMPEIWVLGRAWPGLPLSDLLRWRGPAFWPSLSVMGNRHPARTWCPSGGRANPIAGAAVGG